MTTGGTLRASPSASAADMSQPITAPGSTQVQVEGTVARDFSTMDLSITGSSNASIANTFIRTRSVEGPLSLNLTVNGPPSLQSVSGRVQLTNGQIVDPGVGIRLEDVNATADLAGGRISVDAGANVAAGGRVQVSGPVDLQAGTLDLSIVLDRVIARDPNLYQTEISGNLRMSGSNADGPLISGVVNLGETEIRIPSTGLGGARAIPDINHVGDTRPVRSTRAKAGLADRVAADLGVVLFPHPGLAGIVGRTDQRLQRLLVRLLARPALKAPRTPAGSLLDRHYRLLEPFPVRWNRNEVVPTCHTPVN